MKLIITPFLLLLHVLLVNAQSIAIYRYYHSRIDTIPHEILYDFPTFKKGTVFLKDGTFYSYLFNYNCVLKDMQLLSETGDTLKLTEPFLIDKIAIDSFVYYYDHGYFLRQIKINNEYKLVARKEIVLTTKLIHSTMELGQGLTTSLLSLNYKPLLFFYIGNRHNSFIKANKKGFLKLFGERKDGLQTFIKDHNINFKKEEDILELFQFCSEKNLL